MSVNVQLTPPVAHHDGSPLYVSEQRPELGDAVRVRFRAANDLGVSAAFVRLVRDGEPVYVQASLIDTSGSESWWEATFELTNRSMKYRFALQCADGVLWLNAMGLHHWEPADTHDFRLTTSHTPEWAKDAVFYQIFPDRFARSQAHPMTETPTWAVPSEWGDPLQANTKNGVFQLYRGTLWGIIDHLDYLSELGINALYLTPFFPARSNHRYDASSFDHVDPLLGGDDALRALIAAAHERSIRVIGDLTLNHSGVTHPWFETAQADPHSIEADFYYIDSENRGRYVAFADVPSLPKFDHGATELRRRLYDGPNSVVAYYIREFGLDGWRIDVAQSAGRYRGDDYNAMIAHKTRATIAAERSDGILIAEHQFDATDDLHGDAWDSTMSYASFTKPIWAWLASGLDRDQWGAPLPAPRFGGTELAATVSQYAALIPWQNTLAAMNLLDSHDCARFRTIAPTNQELGVALLFTLPGMPTIFSGDEVGVEGGGLEASRVPFPWNNEEWDHALHTLYQRLISLRHEHPALREGGLRWLYTDVDTVIFERAHPDETLIIAVSRAEHEPIISAFNGQSLLGGEMLRSGAPIPAVGYGFDIWSVSSQLD
ncbi:glycoside hydrolase family 13 protein [Arcanobacterium canis]|uniref:Glycoside hydrolase family 13 protein n=1 Tax=Arcanobacterium canis TaxID=999183 RepID=A0ABY8FZI4_9ACTO|nr:glycoside hydrolase family 13 protein [Arcanobacterium canis]WFM82963.1 glycoside hydrolase family 13 protein [Arcanobacterium canis]